jgi:hypothetical protein
LAGRLTASRTTPTTRAPAAGAGFRTRFQHNLRQSEGSKQAQCYQNHFSFGMRHKDYSPRIYRCNTESLVIKGVGVNYTAPANSVYKDNAKLSFFFS